jgi:hypothetical protein
VIENEILVSSASKSSHGLIVGREQGDGPIEESFVQSFQLEDFGKLLKIQFNYLLN